ncbi:hypothetical protein N3K66_007523 [Trichothecium roseum]|uniref:Uncharacterized protein n=1 Tax=Trichothecium roseum TaxID=47278 RepID=A0ACC0UUQ7_9HYPO|nr:hypothetical protein N3K66_007523 [Trichothecium roseum]
MATSTLPKGSKLWLLDLGHLDCEATALLSTANIALPGSGPIQHERRELLMISALVQHPDVGLILFDVGGGEDPSQIWHPAVSECTPRIWEKGVHGLEAAIEATGAGTIKDVKAVVLSHLHYDHAAGLEKFFDTDVEIWCHEEELKYAFWSCATGMDRAFFVPHYLVPDKLNWKTFNRTEFEIWPGITLHHAPGHTVGSLMMELTLAGAGTVLFTGDLFHVRENYEDNVPQGGPLIRDYTAWYRSSEFAKHLAKKKKAIVVLGHEMAYFKALPLSPAFTE